MSSVRVPSGLYFQSRFFAATTQNVADGWLTSSQSLFARKPGNGWSTARFTYRESAAFRNYHSYRMLEQHPDLTCHRYSDFPNVWTPYWRNYLLEKSPQFSVPKMQERAHQDRIEVSNDSPEAVEEVLWTYFFPARHETDVNQVLDGQLRHQ